MGFHQPLEECKEMPDYFHCYQGCMALSPLDVGSNPSAGVYVGARAPGRAVKSWEEIPGQGQAPTDNALLNIVTACKGTENSAKSPS